jgi:diguanylate cyclase (GGDEF)-like protein/PAS domain S-box-containing protein
VKQRDEPAAGGVQEASGPASAGCCLSLDIDGTIVWAAPASFDVLGWSSDDLSGRHVSIVAPQLGSALDRAGRAWLLHAGEAGTTVVVVALHRDGRAFEASVDLAAKLSAGGGLTGATAIIRNATAELHSRRSRRLARDREPVVILGYDLAVRHATPAAAQLLGLRAADLFPRSGGRIVHPGDRAAVAEAVQRLLADARRVERLVARLRDADGRWRSIEVTVSNCLDDPDLRGLVARLHDVTDKVRTQEDTHLSAALHRAMVETSEEGIVVTGEDGTTRYVNLATARLLGLAADELYTVDLLALLGARDRSRGVDAARQEIVYAHPDDRILAVTSSRLGDDVAGIGSLVTVADVTETRLSERDLRQRALYDSLTGLPNRYLVRDRLEMAAARQDRADGGGTAVLFIDLDGFKPVNDTHGHEAGDELLRQIADRLVAAVRSTDTVGRLGGDEFVVVCEDVGDTGTSYVAGRVQAALKRPFDLGHGPVGIDASIGVAVSPPFSVEQLVHEADAAMYRSKRAGGGTVTVAQP